MDSEHISSRPALGDFGHLGDLYDARSDKLLTTSLLTTKNLPRGVIRVDDAPSLNYRYTCSDSLEEKWSDLGISAELGLSGSCGMLKLGGIMDCLSRSKVNALAQQASVICTTRTLCESLFLGQQLKDCLDLDTLCTQEATHVVWRIDWGAQVAMTVTKTATTKGSQYDFGMQLGNRLQDTARNSGDNKHAANDPAENRGLLRRVVESIGKSHTEGQIQLDGGFNSGAAALEFNINTSGFSDDGPLPTDYEGAMNFVCRAPSKVITGNGGKRVPVTFYLYPIADLARTLNVQVTHAILVQRLDHGCIKRCIQVLEERETILQALREYKERVDEHPSCVPLRHRKKVRYLYGEARSSETGFKSSLMGWIAAVRGGSQMAKRELQEFLGGDDEDDDDDDDSAGSGVLDIYHSIVREYVNKMDFADFVSEKGARYMPHDQAKLSCAIANVETDALYVFEFNDETQKHYSWDHARTSLEELLNDEGNAPYSVLVVDCDMGKAKKLEKAQLMKYRRGEIIVADVFEHERELQDKNLVRCRDVSKVDWSRVVSPPPERRTVRIPCPGRHCCDNLRLKWTCPECSDLVHYGYADKSMCCRCSRYPASYAVFKCRGDKHESEYAEHDPHHLDKLLTTLEPPDELNILILGRTGTGKSMFINAFQNYLCFKTLSDAKADDGGLKYVIPFSFSREERNGDRYEVAVGDETEFESFSRAGQSGTRRTTSYRFTLDDMIIKLIDTPGMGDTRGFAQDKRNMEDILDMLGAIDKLSAVLILLPPDETRLDSSFEFCITFLLSHLHRDIVDNILFVFNKASSTGYRPGGTCVLLDEMLPGLDGGLSRNPSNQFFFDAEGYMCLAAYKQNPPRHWADVDQYEKIWTRSAEEAYHLVSVVMELPTHRVRKTLAVNRVRRVLENMAKPFTHFSATMEQSMRELANLDLERKDLSHIADKLKVTIKIPVRHNLAKRRTVCTYPSCMQSQTVCHDGCDLDAPDEIVGHSNLKRCRALKRWRLIPGHSCKHCKHPWEAHMLVSYELKDETRTIFDQETRRRIKRNKDEAASLRQKITACNDEIFAEQKLISRTRAEFGVYLITNSLVCGYDTYAKHLDFCIEAAKFHNRSGYAADLARQKSTYTAMIQKLRDEIDDGSYRVLDEDGLEKAIENLRSMKIFGQALNKTLDPPHAPLERERLVVAKFSRNFPSSRPFKIISPALFSLGRKMAAGSDL